MKKEYFKSSIRFLQSTLFIGTFTLSQLSSSYGFPTNNSVTTGNISLVKISTIAENYAMRSTPSIRNQYLPLTDVGSHLFHWNSSAPVFSSRYHPLSSVFADFIQKEELSFTLLALQSPIYATIVTDPVTHEEGKISLYDINEKFYLLCEKPHESQVLVELFPDTSLALSDFRYLFRIDSVCEDGGHLYIYLNENGGEIAFQREGNEVFYPMFHKNHQELWQFLAKQTVSDKEKTLDALKTDFQEEKVTLQEKMPNPTFSLEKEDKSLSIFQDSYLTEHLLSIPRETTEDFRIDQEESTLKDRHSNTVEISEKDQRERSVSAFVQDFQGNIPENEDKSSTPVEEISHDYSFEDWENAFPFYERILFQSLMTQVINSSP